MRKRLYSGFLFFLLLAGTVHAQYLVEAEQLYIAPASELQLYAAVLGMPDSLNTLNGVAIYKLRYHTVDVFGNPTIASGAMYVPQSEEDTLPLISNQHGTVMDYRKVPSRRSEDLAGYFFAGNGYITVMADYLGLGDNPGPHPYVHWESEATASIDAIRAAREFLKDSLGIFDNGQLFLAGYSQGGHATMAMHKYIHIHGLQEEFKVVASAPMSGPYSLSYAQLNMMLNPDSSYYKSEFFPYIFASYNLVYGNLYTDYAQYYDPPYDSIFAAWNASGIYFENVPDGFVPDNYYTFMQDSVLDNILANPDHPVNVALRKNDLHNWAPREPVRMLYCEMDTMVTPLNSLTALDTMTALGAPDVQAINVYSQGDHGSCILPAYFYTLQWFDSLAVKSTPISGPSDPSESPNIRIYPNPTTGRLTVEMPGAELYHVELISLSGQSVLNRKMEGSILQLDISGLGKGVYILSLRSKDFLVQRKIVKVD